ncbi:MAG: AAA family ATPase, partial [Bacteroidaceae bacterium]|nr:AAA family ATPase [Bacteroidaceae bacterium]
GTGWIRLDYMSEGEVYVKAPVQNNNSNTNQVVLGQGSSTGGYVNNTSGYRYTGKVIRTNTLNVRANPSDTASKTTTLGNGQALVIYETTTVNGMAWGRCDAGWVYLYYVDLTPVVNGAVDARVKAPCIIFIDEIDAIGRARGKNPTFNSNDERESTLNQLLTEMDGFANNSGVIIIAATNRVEILDEALLRAGRFDRQIQVDLPNLSERIDIFGVHLKPLKLEEGLDIEFLARQTAGFSGADIANVCNEAALIAARHDKKQVAKQDFLDAVDRIIGGLERKTQVMTAEEKKTTAIHEAGHATVSWLLEHANPLVKVTIVPRGRALGAAWYLPEERTNTTKEQMLDEICATLGGRAAEELFTGHISFGALNDLEVVTKRVTAMVAYLGMSDLLPNVSYYSAQESYFQRPYSDKTAELIDGEVRRLIAEQYERAKAILSENGAKHAQLTDLLVEREVIYTEDVENIFGKRPWKSRAEVLLEESAEKKQTEAEASAAQPALPVAAAGSTEQAADASAEASIEPNDFETNNPEITENKQ